MLAGVMLPKPFAFTLLKSFLFVMHKTLVIEQLCSLSPGSPYYDNVRPLCYSDSDAVLLCFDISRPDTVDGALKKVLMLSLLSFVF